MYQFLLLIFTIYVKNMLIVLSSAATALNKITKEDLTLLKSYVNPPK